MKQTSSSLRAMVLGALSVFLPATALAEEAGSNELEHSILSEMASKLMELQWYTVAVLIALVVLFIALYAGARKTKWDGRRVANAAMCIAIAFVLSCIRLYRMPQGGSITPASMLPLVAFAVACGPLQGAIVGCAYGFLNLLQDPYVIHPIQMLVDYPLASAAVALGGLVCLIPMSRKWKLPLAVLIGGIGRYLMAVLSGVVFFAEYAPAGQSALFYSLGYNFTTMGPDTLICIIVAMLPGISRLVDLIRGNIQSTR